MENSPPLPKSFHDLIATADKPVLVDFWAEWCGPCRMVSPAVERIAHEFAGRLLTVKINIDQKPDIAAQYAVQSIPTIILFRQGQPVVRMVGAQSYEEIRRQIEGHLPG
jgi:thioredoxin 1